MPRYSHAAAYNSHWQPKEVTDFIFSENPLKDADTRALERMLEDKLGMTVNLTFGKHGGEVRIRYQTLDQLDALCYRLRGDR